MSKKYRLNALKTSHSAFQKGQTLDSFHPFISLRENERLDVNVGSERIKRMGWGAGERVDEGCCPFLNVEFHLPRLPFFLSRPWQVISWWERAIEGRLLIESDTWRWRERELVSCEENMEVWGKIWEWRRQLGRKKKPLKYKYVQSYYLWLLNSHSSSCVYLYLTAGADSGSVHWYKVNNSLQGKSV